MPKSVANQIDGLLGERGFFEWKSIPSYNEESGLDPRRKWDAAASDGYRWTITAKTSSGIHRVIICEFEGILGHFVERNRGLSNEPWILAEKVFVLSEDVHKLAKDSGTLLDEQ